MRSLLANPSKSRHTYLEDQAFNARLLGRLADQTAHGHRQSKGKARVREENPSVLQTPEIEPASSSHLAGAIHQIEVRTQRVRQLATDAQLHGRANGGLPHEKGKGREQISSAKVRSERNRRHSSLLRERGKEPQSDSQDIRTQCRVRAAIQRRHGSQALSSNLLPQLNELDATHFRLSRGR